MVTYLEPLHLENFGLHRPAGRGRMRVDRAVVAVMPLFCSFCAKSQDELQTLIAGPGVLICDECLDICLEIVAHKRNAAREDDRAKQAIEMGRS